MKNCTHSFNVLIINTFQQHVIRRVDRIIVYLPVPFLESSRISLLDIHCISFANKAVL